MAWQYTPYVWYLIASTVMSAGLGGYAWRRGSVPGATAFAGLSVITVVWSLTNALEMTATGLATKTFWANVQYLCYATVGMACLNLALHYTGRRWWLNRRRFALLSIIPVVTVVLVWTNRLHGLMRRNVSLDTTGPFPVIAKTYGPWFWVFAVYSYSLMLVSLALFATHLPRIIPAYQGQSSALMAGLLMPLISNALYTLGLSPVPKHDITPAAFAVSGAVIAWGLFRHRLFDIVPVAYANIIANMSDGMILLDAQSRIVEMNPAAQGIFGVTSSRAVGRKCDEVLDGWPALWDGAVENEIALDSGRHYDVYSSALTCGRLRQCGRIVVIHDVTENRNTHAVLARQQRDLAVAQERERLARELHDSLGQVLGYINVQAQAVHELVSAGDAPAASHQLERLIDVAQEAHASMREYIRNMRETTSSGGDFVSLLQEQISRFERQTGIQARLVLPENAGSGMFRSAAEIQILKIVKEALANIRKHARATSVEVSIMASGSAAQITIKDNGCGFKPGATSAGNGRRFGLDIMRERAQEAGGTFEIRSAPGEGTTVVARVPLFDGRREAGS